MKKIKDWSNFINEGITLPKNLEANKEYDIDGMKVEFKSSGIDGKGRNKVKIVINGTNWDTVKDNEKEFKKSLSKYKKNV